MADATIPLDTDPVADVYVDVDQRTVNSVLVQVPKCIVVDGVANYKLTVNSDGSINVKSLGAFDSASRGATGTGAASASITTDAQILAAGTTRRAVWITNTSSTIRGWIKLGGAAAVVNEGIPVPPNATVIIDRAPNAAIRGISESTGIVFAYQVESD